MLRNLSLDTLKDPAFSPDGNSLETIVEILTSLPSLYCFLVFLLVKTFSISTGRVPKLFSPE